MAMIQEGRPLPVSPSGPREVGRSRALGEAAAQVGLAAILTAVLALLLSARLHNRTDPALLTMGNMGMAWGYWASRAFGFSALIWSAFAVALGLLVAGRTARRLPATRAQLDRWHQQASLVTIALTFLHALLLVFDGMGDGLVRDFVPFTQPYHPAWIPEGAGIIAFWLMLLLGPTYYLRRRLGPRAGALSTASLWSSAPWAYTTPSPMAATCTTRVRCAPPCGPLSSRWPRSSSSASLSLCAVPSGSGPSAGQP